MQELGPLRQDIHTLQAAIADPPGAAAMRTEVGELHTSIAQLQQQLSPTVLNALARDGATLSSMARRTDLAELQHALSSKADRSAVQRVAASAAERALAQQRSNAEADGAMHLALRPASARAIKAACLACDQDVAAVRPASIGPLPSAAGLLPRSEAAKPHRRPATAGAMPRGPGLNAKLMQRLAFEAAVSHTEHTAKASPARRPGSAQSKATVASETPTYSSDVPMWVARSTGQTARS